MKIVLFSDYEIVMKKTQEVLEEDFELQWYRYNNIFKQQYPDADIIIVDFDRKRIREGTFLPIIRIRGKMGEDIPILAIINGTPQEVFAVLKAGVYDYIKTVENTQDYKRKLKDIVLWKWYRNKYKCNSNENKNA